MKRFTLIELLVVIASFAILAVMLLPALGHARRMPPKTACASSLKQNSLAMVLYGNDFDGYIQLNGGTREGGGVWYENPFYISSLAINITGSGSLSGAWQNNLRARPSTFCPIDTDVTGATPHLRSVAYGALALTGRSLSDYEEYSCETGGYTEDAVLPGPTYVISSLVPEPSSYILLMDTAIGMEYYFTHFPDNDFKNIGVQAAVFWREKENVSGGTLTLRHLGTGNLAFLDGHVEDSRDLEKLHKSSFLKGYLYDGGWEIFIWDE